MSIKNENYRKEVQLDVQMKKYTPKPQLLNAKIAEMATK